MRLFKKTETTTTVTYSSSEFKRERDIRNELANLEKTKEGLLKEAKQLERSRLEELLSSTENKKESAEIEKRLKNLVSDDTYVFNKRIDKTVCCAIL